MVDIPNNGSTTTTLTVTWIPQNSEVASVIEVAGDTDWIRVNLEAGKAYQFYTGPRGTSTFIGLQDTVLTLRDSTGKIISSNDDDAPGSFTSRVGIITQTSGTYYLEVKGFETDIGGYVLTGIQDSPPPVYTTDQIANQLTTVGWTDSREIPHHFNVSAGGSLTVNMAGLTADGQFFAREALKVWSDATGVRFVETTGTAQIIFDDTDSNRAYCNEVHNNGETTSATINVGTGWIANYGTGLNSYSFQTYIREIGHALGLADAGLYNIYAQYAVNNHYLNDSWQATVMSFFSQSDADILGNSFAFVMTPMMADLVAIQNLYGVSTTTRTGNTVYGFNSNAGNPIYNAAQFNNVSYTVFDSGGIDTLDFSGFSQAQKISLLAETFSNVGGLIGNIGVARGVVIENAIGGSNNDSLIGNSASNLLQGNSGNDTLDGVSGNDSIQGGAGNDTIFARFGTSTFDGGTGADMLDTRFHGNLRVSVIDLSKSSAIFYSGSSYTKTVSLVTNVESITAGSSIDYLIGGSLNDRFDGGGGDDKLYGAAGADVLLGADGADWLYGDLGDDYGHGGIGNDRLFGGDGNDVLNGGADDDELKGESGTDTIDGGLGRDKLFGGAGIDRLSGGSDESQDPAAFDDRTQSDILEGGAGADILVGKLPGWSYLYAEDDERAITDGDIAAYTGSASAVTIDMGLGVATGGDAAGDTFINIFGLRGSRYADFLTGNDLNNLIEGELGVDTLRGRAGSDLLYGGADADFLYGDAGDDALYGGAGNDLLDGGDGNDIFFGGLGNDTVQGGDGNDTIWTSEGQDTLDGGSGTDWLRLAGERQTYEQFFVFELSAYVDMSKGTVAHKGFESSYADIENVFGGYGDDIILGDEYANIINCDLGGSDYIEGRGGADRFIGGYSSWTQQTIGYKESKSGVTINFFTGKGTGGDAEGDTFELIYNVIGSAFADVLVSNHGGNIIEGGGGADALYGNGGTDKLSYESSSAGVRVSFLLGTGIGGDAQGDTLSGFEILLGSAHNDHLTGSNADDTLNGDQGGDELFGLNGSDSLYGGDGNDLLDGGAGDDLLFGGLGADRYVGGDGIDVASYENIYAAVTIRLDFPNLSSALVVGDTYDSIEKILGSNLGDFIVGDSFRNALDGNYGDDSIMGQGGDDTLNGGYGSDQRAVREQTYLMEVQLSNSILLAMMTQTGGT
ncbi:MAG: M10 family metallopeptidase C-terminal domain-containing protein [Rhizobiaceae bacterium]